VTEVLVAIVLALLVALIFAGMFLGKKREADLVVPEPVQPFRQPCPLCGSQLAAGERVHSVVYATKTEDKIMEIAGCPHCRPPATLHRQCPVCKKALRPQDVVTARVFERKNETGSRKTHVHVLGCPRCRS
jgi:hypothetical protein